MAVMGLNHRDATFIGDDGKSPRPREYFIAICVADGNILQTIVQRHFIMQRIIPNEDIRALSDFRSGVSTYIQQVRGLKNL